MNGQSFPGWTPRTAHSEDTQRGKTKQVSQGVGLLIVRGLERTVSRARNIKGFSGECDPDCGKLPVKM